MDNDMKGEGKRVKEEEMLPSVLGKFFKGFKR